MIAVSELSIVKPNEVEPGTLLIGGAHYDDPPMFVFDFGEERFRFDLGGSNALNGLGMAVNLHPYIRAGKPTLLVDVDARISPTKSDIPDGSVVLIGTKAHFAIKMNYGTAYIGIDGKMIEDPKSYDRFVAFSRWQLVVPAFDDDWLVAFEAGTVESNE